MLNSAQGIVTGYLKRPDGGLIQVESAAGLPAGFAAHHWSKSGDALRIARAPIGIGSRAGAAVPSGAMTDPDTIVLIHGLWMTPRSWEHWIDRYGAAGRGDRARSYPGIEGEVEALSADTSPIDALGVAGRRPLRGDHPGAGRPADHHGPLVRRRAHAACSTAGTAPPASRSTRSRSRACARCR